MANQNVEAINQRIGRNIRTLRLLKGHTQKYMAERLEPPLSDAQIVNYEKGDDKIPAYRLVQIIDILECTLPQLFDGVSEFLPSGDAITAREGALIKAYRSIDDEEMRVMVSELVKVAALLVAGKFSASTEH